MEDASKPKTGDTIKIVDNKTGNTLKTYTVVVFGDVNGDGIYDGQDATVVSMIIGGMIRPDAATRLAADCNHDGVINSADLTLLEEAGILLSQVDQLENIQTSSVFAAYSEIISQDVPAEEPKTDEPTEEKPTSLVRKFYENLVSFFRYLFKIL